MQRTRFKSLSSLNLRDKMILATLMPLTVVVTLMLVLYAYRDLQDRRYEVESHTQAIIQVLIQDFERLYRLDDQTIAADLSRKLSQFDQIKSVIVQSRAGGVVYGYRRPGTNFILLPRVDETSADFRDDEMLLRIPVQASSLVEGLDFVTVRVSLKEAWAARHNTLGMALGLGLVSLLFGVACAVGLERVISRPMLELQHTAEAVMSTGDFSLRASIDSHDEVGRVAQAFNETLAAMQFNRTMIEAKVDERTAALHASERRFREFLESAPDAIMIIDLDGKLILANQRVEQLFGFGQAALGQVHARDLLGETWNQIIEYYRQMATQPRGRGAGVRSLHNTQGLRLDGSSFPVDLTVSQFVREGESLMSICVRDITERKLMENQLSQAQKLESIGQLAAGIAHEINTPIQFIGDNARFLKDSFGELCPLLKQFHALVDVAEGWQGADTALLEQARAALRATDWEFVVEEIPAAIDQSLDGVGRVAQIVRAMKDFSHPDGEMEYIDLNRAIESTLVVCRNEYKYVADVETFLDPALPLVPCYSGEFNQVILNMVINASHAIADVIKAGKTTRGRITVGTRAEGEAVLIRICDTGSGIPESLRTRIFDPFFTTKEVGKGTGQGLSIAHNVIVKKHRGRIDVDSEVGIGSVFTIELPLHRVELAMQG